MTRTEGRFRVTATKAQLEAQLAEAEVRRAAMTQCERFFAAVDANGVIDVRTISREARHARRLLARTYLFSETDTEEDGRKRAFDNGFRVKPFYIVPSSLWLPIARGA
ncbi:MAG: hypothetical protein WDM94_09305 [Bauldia sp.]